MSGVIAAAGITAAAGIGGALLTPKGGGTTTSTSSSQVPMGVQQRESDNYDLAMQAANQLMGPYSGQRVADLTPEQRDLIARMYGRVGGTDAAYDTASSKANALLNFSGGQLTPEYLRNANLQPYMNPYTQAIIDPSMALIEQQRRQALNQTGATAAQTGAFGGSRQGVQEGVTNAQTALQAGAFGANLYSQNFLNAQARAGEDLSRNWAGQTANLASRQWDAAFQADRANQIANLAAGKQQSFLAGLAPALQGQGVLQQQQQAELAAAQAYYNEQRQQPLDVLKIRQNALAAGAPIYGKESTQTAPSGTSTSPLMAGLGTASTVAGLFGTLGKAGLFDWGKDPTMGGVV